MTISSTVTSQTMIGDGIVREFPFTFRAWEGEVRVIITTPEGQETDVAASCVITLFDEGGGLVEYPVSQEAEALPAGHRLTIMRSMDFFQGLDLLPTARYDSGVIEDQFDRLVAQDQQLREELERAVKVPVAGGKKPQDLVNELFDAKDRAETSAVKAAGHETAAALSASASANAAEAAGQSAAAAAAARDVARQWAANPEDAVVENNQYSAYHWAQKAQAAATGGALLSDELNGTRRAADMVGASEWALAQAYGLAQTAKGRAEAANTTAGAAGTSAEAAQATADEATSKAAQASSAAATAQATADEALAAAGASSGGGGFNTIATITTSRTWTAPVSGWARVKVIGGGGGGGKAYGAGGAAGGASSFSSVSAIGGSGGAGSSSGGATGGGGGGSGTITTAYVKLSAGSDYSVIIGSGGAGGTTLTISAGGNAGASNSVNIGTCAPGASIGQTGVPFLYNGSINYWLCGNGGSGAVNGTGYGSGGGGGGCGTGQSDSEMGIGGSSGIGAVNGSNGTTRTPFGGQGGAGGAGAVIIEYYNPSLD